MTSKTKLILKIVLGAALTAISPFAIIAQSDKPELDAGSQRMLKSRDMAFSVRAAREGLAQVELGRLAAKEADSPAIRNFAEKMVNENTRADKELAAIAQKQHVTLPATMDPGDQRLFDKLKKLSGAQFDKAYTKKMVKDHKGDVKQFQKEADRGKNPQIKSFAGKFLPQWQSELQQAELLRSEVNSGS